MGLETPSRKSLVTTETIAATSVVWLWPYTPQVSQMAQRKKDIENKNSYGMLFVTLDVMSLFLTVDKRRKLIIQK